MYPLLIAYKSAVSDQVRMMIKNILMSLIKFIVHHTKDEASLKPHSENRSLGDTADDL